MGGLFFGLSKSMTFSASNPLRRFGSLVWTQSQAREQLPARRNLRYGRRLGVRAISLSLSSAIAALRARGRADANHQLEPMVDYRWKEQSKAPPLAFSELISLSPLWLSCFSVVNGQQGSNGALWLAIGELLLLTP